MLVRPVIGDIVGNAISGVLPGETEPTCVLSWADRVIYAVMAQPITTNDFRVTVRFKTTPTADNQVILSSTTSAFRMLVDTTNDGFQVFMNNVNHVFNPRTYTDGQWHKIIVEYNVNSGQLRVRDDSGNSEVFSAPGSDMTVAHVGRRNDNASAYFAGALDYIVIEDFQNGVSARWNFNSHSLDTEPDVLGTNDLTYSNVTRSNWNCPNIPPAGYGYGLNVGWNAGFLYGYRPPENTSGTFGKITPIDRFRGLLIYQLAVNKGNNLVTFSLGDGGTDKISGVDIINLYFEGFADNPVNVEWSGTRYEVTDPQFVAFLEDYYLAYGEEVPIGFNVVATNEAYRGLITTSSTDGGGYLAYRKVGTAGMFVHETAGDEILILYDSESDLYTLAIEKDSVTYLLNHNDDNNSGSSQGYYYFVPPSAVSHRTVWFPIADINSFVILDPLSGFTAGSEFFDPNYWVRWNLQLPEITFSIV